MNKKIPKRYEFLTVKDDKLNALDYFLSCKKYGSLFIFENGEERVVSEIKNINDGNGEISFVPISEDRFFCQQGETISCVNESNNISFQTKVIANHGNKWVTLEIPHSLKMINLRKSPRIVLKKQIKAREMKISSYGEEGLRKLMEHRGDVLDLSSMGAAFEISERRVDGYYKGDIVKIKISDKHSFLSNVDGMVVHKTLFHDLETDSRSYHIGVKFSKELDLTPILD